MFGKNHQDALLTINDRVVGLVCIRLQVNQMNLFTSQNYTNHEK